MPTPSSLGLARPRHHVAQPHDADMVDLLVPFARGAGYELLLWQRRELADWSATKPDGTWVHQRCGNSVPRQQGKSVDGLVWAWALASMMGYRVLWTDHKYDTAGEMLDRTRDVFGTKAGDMSRGIREYNRLVRRTNSKTGQEAYWFKGGGKLAFSTRTDTGGLGKGFDVVVFDEAQELRDSHTQAILPMMTSGPKKNPQVIYLGTPRRLGSPAEKFEELRDEALTGAAEDLCWLEYGVDGPVDVNDETVWPQVMPSLGAHATAQAIRIMRKGMSAEAFLQEALGYWFPHEGAVARPPVDAVAWDVLEVAEGPRFARRRAFGVKYSTDGDLYALVGAAWDGGDGPVHVELLAHEGAVGFTATLARWVLDRADEACCCVMDGKARAAALEDEFRRIGAPCGYAVRARSEDAVAANAMLVDAVGAGGLTHLADPVLTASATESVRRPIGSGGGWGFDGAAPEVVEAAALAVWAVRTSRRNPRNKARVHV